MRLCAKKGKATSREGRRSCSAAAGSSAGANAPPGAIGILGGIFDPVHNGHLALAARAKEHFRLSKVLFVPSGRPPHKTRTGAGAADRFALLCLALRRDPSFAVWDGELRRRGVSYTIDTLADLSREFPGCQYYFLVGSDNLKEITTWRDWRAVLASVTLCVARRPGHAMTIPPSIRVGRIETFPSPGLAVSSTAIREKIARGRPFRHLVPKEVAEYISTRQLYKK
jgi:nicotinate-nucleotide adenylyltransferase